VIHSYLEATKKGHEDMRLKLELATEQLAELRK
jgi:hypothetical protein